VRILEVLLELLREECALHDADVADVRAEGHAKLRGAAERPASEGADSEDGEAADDSVEAQHDDADSSARSDGDGGVRARTVSLSSLLQADTAFEAAFDALGVEDDVVDPQAPTERALASVAIGSFLTSFVHSLAQSRPHELQGYLNALGHEDDRLTVQRTLLRGVQ
jgi:hypothetical protein